ncbi:MAG: tetrathionate reductase family octaheme c-type cytochrome [Desulfobacterales bacterium]
MESNWCSCAKCHAGYGMEDETFDFENGAVADCLVCHDNSGTYKKDDHACGQADRSVDLAEAAKSVGKPERSNCGTCHWYGGGGDNVKHGDMDSTLADPSREHDVHMGGLDFTCQECHTTEDHKIAGRSTTASVSEGKVACTDCHGQSPHDSSSPLMDELNDHSDAVSCEACHIPKYAREKKTTTLWDWSESGGENEVIEETDEKEKFISRKKGLLVREKNLTPDYEWYNGKHRRYIKGDSMDLDGVTYLNPPEGDIDDPEAKITPYKLMRGVEPADKKHTYKIVPKLYGEGGYFENYDWEKASEKGMQAAGLEFSGEVAFAETIMHWRLNHQVAPKEDALSCLDCHSPDGVMDFRELGYEGDPAETGKRKTDD